jgi:hypothetical protein
MKSLPHRRRLRIVLDHGYAVPSTLVLVRVGRMLDRASDSIVGVTLPAILRGGIVHAHVWRGSTNSGRSYSVIPRQAVRVIPSGKTSLGFAAVKEVVELACSLWLSSAFRGGSPEGALFTALEMMREKTSAVVFMIPGRYSMGSDPT